jgi:putative endonuclease
MTPDRPSWPESKAKRAAARLAARRLRGGRARQEGRTAEFIAVFWLMAKGWRILAFRLKTPQAEIDLLARRGRTLAVVEVKRRATRDEALEAVGYRQRARLRAAAENLIAQRADFAGLSVRLDLIALAPRRRPCHIADAWAGMD